jgi:hypothetical protein
MEGVSIYTGINQLICFLRTIKNRIKCSLIFNILFYS